jgi:hypothetical protein
VSYEPDASTADATLWRRRYAPERLEELARPTRPAFAGMAIPKKTGSASLDTTGAPREFETRTSYVPPEISAQAVFTPRAFPPELNPTSAYP